MSLTELSMVCVNGPKDKWQPCVLKAIATLSYFLQLRLQTDDGRVSRSDHHHEFAKHHRSFIFILFCWHCIRKIGSTKGFSQFLRLFITFLSLQLFYRVVPRPWYILRMQSFRSEMANFILFSVSGIFANLD